MQNLKVMVQKLKGLGSTLYNSPAKIVMRMVEANSGSGLKNMRYEDVSTPCTSTVFSL